MAAAAPPAAPKRAGRGMQIVRALYDYNAARPDELSFKEGDILYVLDQSADPNWWKCRCNNKEGLVPFNYVGGENAEAIDNPVHEAAKRGNVPFLQELLGAGISVNGLDHAGNTPLHWACRGGHVDCVKLLLSKTPVLDKANKLGDTPLHSAAWGGHSEVIKLLLEKGVDRYAVNKDNQTAYQLAKTTEAKALLQELVADADYDPAGNDPDSD